MFLVHSHVLQVKQSQVQILNQAQKDTFAMSDGKRYSSYCKGSLWFKIIKISNKACIVVIHLSGTLILKGTGAHRNSLGQRKSLTVLNLRRRAICEVVYG